jgi:hypothetical protein
LFFPPAFFWCFLPCSPLWCGGEMRKGARGEKPPAADGTAPAVERSFWPRACRTRRIGLPRSSLCSLPWFACSQYLGRSNRGTPQPRRDLRSAPVAARAGQLSFIIASNTTRSM